MDEGATVLEIKANDGRTIRFTLPTVLLDDTPMFEGYLQANAGRIAQLWSTIEVPGASEEGALD